MEYYANGLTMLETMSGTAGSPVVMQCRILQAIYLQLCLGPIGAWKVITHVSRDCMHILASS